MKSVTQLDIAKALGISQTTVGLVVGSSRDERKLAKLSQETIERIRQKAEQMGYRPHRHAQVMRTGRSMQVGIIYTQNHLQVASERVSSVVSALHESGYDPIFFDAHWHRGDVRAAINYFTSAKVAGILLLAGYTRPEELEVLRAIQVPMVGLSVYQLGNRAEVRCDMREGILSTFRHLVAQGCRKIALVAAEEVKLETLTEWSWQQESQVQGLREGAAEGCWNFEIIPLRDYEAWSRRSRSEEAPGAAVVLCSTREMSATKGGPDPYRSPKLFAQQLLDSDEPLPDAILFPNDEWAYGFACEAMRRGIRIPQDLRISGFNDSALGQAFTVPLTSVRQPTEAMANKAVKLLIEEIEGHTTQRHPHYIPGELKVRESTLLPPQKS